jgi:predicted DNA-binding ribbon-helix-helix protein
MVMSDNGKLATRKNQTHGVASLIARPLVVAGRDVQVRLEPSYWEGLDEICRREDLTADELCADVQERMEQQNRRLGGQGGVSLANALRVFVVGYFRQAATERGHARAGHGQGDPFASTPFDRSSISSDA